MMTIIPQNFRFLYYRGKVREIHHRGWKMWTSSIIWRAVPALISELHVPKRENIEEVI
jgi:hypothetical protein